MARAVSGIGAFEISMIPRHVRKSMTREMRRQSFSHARGTIFDNDRRRQRILPDFEITMLTMSIIPLWTFIE